MSEHVRNGVVRPPKTRNGYRMFQVAVTVVECYAFAEIAWYLTHNEHLYVVIGEQVSRFRAGLVYRAQVVETLRMIRRLPERRGL